MPTSLVQEASSLTSVGRLCEKTKQRLILRDYTELKTSPGHKEVAVGPQQLLVGNKWSFIFSLLHGGERRRSVVFPLNVQLFKP